jgi:hypothetical protein
MTEEGKAWWVAAVLENEIERIWLWSWQEVLYYGFSIDIGDLVPHAATFKHLRIKL